MTVQEAKRRKRARRALRQWKRSTNVGLALRGAPRRLLSREVKRSIAVAQRPCQRCNGSGIDPVRRGYPGEVPMDPEWCDRCGGAG